MRVELFPFQKIALANLREQVAEALGSYYRTHTPQIVSYTAPTGAGKTIIMSALIEDIYFGDGKYPEQPEAIFVWLSDSPQLNEQSKLKIDLKADKIRLNQCVTISDESFDAEILEDGHIYFLNTQKLSKTSNLTKHSDNRLHTIWETLANTVREKSDRLYFIIDEAHRGAQKGSELAKATTIMQKFLKGSPSDRLPPMPVVIGMTATAARFNRLAEGIQSTTHYVKTTPEDVRASGLLKDRIVITYPESTGNDMAVLQAATDEWDNKCKHWYQYCYEQHYAMVNPIFVIQVQNGNAHTVSMTDLGECLRIIEDRLDTRFLEGQVVHAFGEGTPTLEINGLKIPYVEPSRIADEKRVKVVFFKETLSTGWDCPRAETMMSFRHASDHTYIAQLLGRMVRTPMQMHINVDETLNDVHLYLPQFNASTVYDVVNALQSAEGGNIPTDIEAEELGSDNYETLTIRPTYTTPPRQPARRTNIPEGQISIDEHLSWSSQPQAHVDNVDSGNNNSSVQPQVQEDNVPQGSSVQVEKVNRPLPVEEEQEAQPEEVTERVPVTVDRYEFDREEVVKAVNDMGLLTYDVRHVLISDYLKSVYALARFLTQTRIDIDAKNQLLAAIVERIHNHIKVLKDNNGYDALASQVLQFKLSAQTFDVFGRTIDYYHMHDFFMTTDADLERQFRLAEAALGNEGVGNAYLNRYYNEEPLTDLKIHVIIFAASEASMSALRDFAKERYHTLNDTYRRRMTALPESFRKKYDDIVSNGDIISKHNFRLPETIRMPRDPDGKLYENHLFVDDSGTACIKLNSWEEKTIDEEQSQEDFVCWIRNPSRGSWALRIPYEVGGDKKPMYPDFLIVRSDGYGYIVDILEPHDPSRIDNLGKAKGLAEYARQNPGAGRIQLIKMKRDALGRERPFRLDMSRGLTREKILHCASNDELNNIFDAEGFFNN